MDFTFLKQKALQLKDKTLVVGKNALNYSASKLAESSLTLKTKADLEAFIKKSQNTKLKNSTSGEEKEYTHRVIVVFCDTKTEFFTSMLYALPVLSAKAFSQNINLKLADSAMKDIDIETYGLSSFPALLVFENLVHKKTLLGEEKIQKVVKSLSLDINTTIDAL